MHVNTMSTFNQTTTSIPLSLIATITIITTMLALPACSPDGTVVTTIITAASVSDSGDDESATDGASASTTADPTTTDATTTTTSTTDNPTTEASTYGFDATDSSTTGEPPPGACGEPGSLFGPCIDGLGCLGPFGCFARPGGNVCIPGFNTAVAMKDEVDACIRQLGGSLVCGAEDIIPGWCVVSCGIEACSAGLVCDEGNGQIASDSVCVHPW